MKFATVICLLSVPMMCGALHAELQYSDGGSHSIDGVIAEPIVVSDATLLVYSAELSRESIVALLSPEEVEDFFDGGPAPLGIGIEVRSGSKLVVQDGIQQCHLDEDSTICFPNVRANAATVEMQSGSIHGRIGMELENGSLLQMTDGMIGGDWHGVTAENSRVMISGGEIGDGAIGDVMIGIRLAQDSSFEMTGGAINAVGFDLGTGIELNSGSVEIAGGKVSGSGILDSQGNGILAQGGVLSISGGNISARGNDRGVAIGTSGDAQVVVTGGEISNSASAPSAVLLGGTSQATVHGGQITFEQIRFGVLFEYAAAIEVVDDAQLTLFGGEFAISTEHKNVPLLDFATKDNGYVEVHGSEFNYPLDQPIEDLTGTITGVWPDGTPMELDFLRGPTATIRLVPIPEPSSAVLLLIGLFAFVRRTH